MIIPVSPSPSHGIFSLICQRHASVAAWPTPGSAPCRPPSSPLTYLVSLMLIWLGAAVCKSNAGETPGTMTDAGSQHPPGPNSNTEAVIGWLLLNTYNPVLPAFVQWHLLQCIEHKDSGAASTHCVCSFSFSPALSLHSLIPGCSCQGGKIRWIDAGK